MGKRGDFHALIIGSENTASYKIGIEQPFRHLKERGICSFEVKTDEDVKVSTIAAADVVIFLRTVKQEVYKSLELAREMGKKTVYVIDDHFMAMSPGTDIGAYYHESSRKETYVRFLKNAHILKVASGFFARHLETHFRPNKVVCFPGSVNFSLFDGLEKRSRHDDEVTIGYEGGRKALAFGPVIEALKSVVSKYGDKVRIEFYGYIPPEIVGKLRVFYSHHDSNYKSFLKHLYRSRWDIGLAPLEPTLLHDCKTNNKFREYGACWIPGIYSSSPAYMDWVTNKETGMLVSQNSDDWYMAMVEMIEHPELRRKIAENAERVSRENFSIESCADHWHKQILMSE